MNVYEKLNAARKEFHGLKLTKTGHNKFAGYYYFELGDFLIPALEVFSKNGLCGTISFTKDVAKMCVVNIEKPDEYIPFESPMGSAALKGCHEVQNIGAVETYQRRYLWVAALEIVEHDALDATTGADKSANMPQAPITPTTGAWENVTAQQQSRLTDLAQIAKEYIEVDDMAAALKVIDDADLGIEEKLALFTRFDKPTIKVMTKFRKDNASVAMQP